MNFKNWLRINIEIEPREQVNKNILNEASLLLGIKQKTNTFFRPVTISVLSILIIISFIVIEKRDRSQFIGMNKQRNLEDESIEMLLNYNQIELMADASSLDENDWKRIK